MRFGLGLSLGLYRRRASSAPLDAVAALLVVAYGLRRLVSTWTGPLVTVRRSSDNATMDVYAAYSAGEGWIDTVALLAWCGSASAYVTRIWDQSGRSQHAVQTTASAQPMLVDAGMLITLGGRPALNIASGQGFLAPTANINGQISVVASIQCSSYSQSVTQGITKGSYGSSAVVYVNTSNAKLSLTYGSQSIIGTELVNGVPYISEILIDGPRSTIKLNSIVSSIQNSLIPEGSILYANLQVFYVDGDMSKSIKGKAGEFIIINRKLTDEESVRLFSDLATPRGWA